MTNLMQASNQWATRPNEERFWSLDELDTHLREEASTQKEYTIGYSDVSVVAPESNQELVLEVKSGARLALNNWSLRQLADRLDIPFDVLGKFKRPTIVAMMRDRLTDVTVGMSQDNLLSEDDFDLGIDADVPANESKMKMLVNFKDRTLPVVRSITSETYGRKYDMEIVGVLRHAEDQGWRVPPARPCNVPSERTRVATEEDVLRNQNNFGGLSVKAGDVIGPSGIYRNDRNAFFFYLDDSHTIEDGTDSPLKRGFFVQNTEVGDNRMLSATFFLYKSVCGNHIVWGAQGVTKVATKHRKRAVRVWDDSFFEQIDMYKQSPQSEDKLISAAKRHILGKDCDGVVEELFQKKSAWPQLTRTVIEGAYGYASQWEHVYKAPPTSAWGFVQGLTMYSQRCTHTDTRSTLDIIGGKILERVKLEDAPITTGVPATITDGNVIVDVTTTKKPRKSTVK